MTLRLKAALIFLCASHLSWGITLDYAPKITLRTSTGHITNTVNDKSALILGGFNVLAHFFLTEWLAAGAGFDVSFDMINSTTPLKGFDVEGRAYFWGVGTVSSFAYEEIVTRRRELGAAYFISRYSFRNFAVPDANNEIIEGGISAINVGLGYEHALSEKFDINVEANSTVIGFSNQPEKVNLRWMLLSFGLGYIF